ncbi:ParA family protein [Pelomonas sp. CA6]|uniref:ParA family protein n=1 Tax=Pelomonas sp. CA6 TaxID=2907999 RepID=UPI001F4BDA74|nr:ParA family protein [Pelomonas sp. CA6]MCH7345564.1 ParA family protein [Pelomonas sp. CA6]
MTQIITLYNHKGGVSKTTTTYHLAYAFAESMDMRVLVVDADPQCNLTELCLAKVIDALDEQEEGGEATVLPGTSVKEALWPRLEGERGNVDVEAIKLTQFDDNLPLFIFRGDIGLSEAEDRLSYAYSQRSTSDMHQKRTYVAVHDMLRRLGDLHKFDVILIDVGPSAAALTRSFFLSCDRFLVPVAPDRFNYQAMGSLSQILRQWILEHMQIVPDFQKLSLNVPTKAPILSGIVMQRFQRHKGMAKAGFKVWIDRVRTRAIEELIPSLISAAGSDGVSKHCLTEPVCAEIHDFASLAPMMLSNSKPIWKLTKEDTDWQGNVWDQRVAAMEEFKQRFFALAKLALA